MVQKYTRRSKEEDIWYKEVYFARRVGGCSSDGSYCEDRGRGSFGVVMSWIHGRANP